MSRGALLVLADGRFPAGGHAHSGGAEAAVKAGRVTGAATLGEFCRGRLHTAGLVSAAVAAAAVLGADPGELDLAVDARTPSPALRVASRRLGRQLMRAARATWPSAELDALAREFPKGAHQPVVLGLVARSAGLGAEDAAYCAAYESVSGPAVRDGAVAEPGPLRRYGRTGPVGAGVGPCRRSGGGGGAAGSCRGG